MSETVYEYSGDCTPVMGRVVHILEASRAYARVELEKGERTIPLRDLEILTSDDDNEGQSSPGKAVRSTRSMDLFDCEPQT